MSAKFQKPHLLGLTAAAILCLLFSNPVVAGGNPSDEAEAYASQQDNIVKGTVPDERRDPCRSFGHYTRDIHRYGDRQQGSV